VIDRCVDRVGAYYVDIEGGEGDCDVLRGVFVLRIGGSIVTTKGLILL